MQAAAAAVAVAVAASSSKQQQAQQASGSSSKQQQQTSMTTSACVQRETVILERLNRFGLISVQFFWGSSSRLKKVVRVCRWRSTSTKQLN